MPMICTSTPYSPGPNRPAVKTPASSASDRASTSRALPSAVIVRACRLSSSSGRVASAANAWNAESIMPS